MNTIRNAGALLLGLLPLLAACAQPHEVDDELEAPLSPQGGGEHTTNGFPPDKEGACQYDMLTSMGYQLEVSGGALNSSLPASVKPVGYENGTGTCTPALKYAFECAGASGATLPPYSSAAISGEGLMNVGDWRNGGGLGYADQVDVFTCMSAHLNYFTGVPICLEGPQVNGTGDCADDYPIVEAVWLSVPGAGGVTQHVWPIMPAFTCGNEAAIQAALQMRVCDGYAGCNVTVHSYADLATQCVYQGGESYSCLGYPAVTTYLTYAGYEEMYPRCRPPR